MTRASSQSLPLFEQSCNEVLQRVQNDSSPDAVGFRVEAESLLAVLEGWKSELPRAEDRGATIAKVFDLYRRAMEYLTADKA